MIFEILTFDFYLEAIVNYCLYECNHIILKKMKELVYPTQYCVLLVNLFVNITTKRFIG